MKKATAHRAGPCGVSIWFMMLAMVGLLVTMTWHHPAHAQTTRVQFAHASPDPAVEVVDVYLDDALIMDDFTYRTGTAFLDVAAGQEVTITLADAASTSAAEAIATFPQTFQSDKAYYVVVAGVLDPASFDPNPDGLDTALRLYVADDALDSGINPSDGDVEGRFFHGIPDAPAVDFIGTVPKDATYEFLFNLHFGAFSAWVFTPTVPNLVGQMVLASNHAEQLSAVKADFTGLDSETLLSLVTGTYRDAGSIASWILLANGEVLPSDNVTAVEPDGASGAVPEMFRLLGNYPNPFNPSTTVLLDLPQPATVRLAVFDLLGRQVLRLPERDLPAGAGRRLRVDASTLPSGLYVYRVMAEMPGLTHIHTGRMVLLK